ncbi:hypothetical protein HCU62_10070 [Dissulfurirhabdus thermomarina]|uniref:hypothetical protein n=1 Tax=Dissulfurirhabdus thermomarina TaxID=1765737 RepID=UPI00147080F9|nr:hypothetical protein [Dissulfurirhabdus thermomarina]NMX24272.1 hypothetical protein [Dissulfurirhabdus thermomarina]
MSAPPAWAVQDHGGGEGLMAHEIGHLLLMAGAAYILFRMAVFRSADPGWREFRAFLWWLLAWNLLVLAGHWIRPGIPAGRFILEGGRHVAFEARGGAGWLFYASRFDHLVLLPAFGFFLAALRKWRRAP